MSDWTEKKETKCQNECGNETDIGNRRAQNADENYAFKRKFMGLTFIKAFRLPNQICHGEAHQERYCFIISVPVLPSNGISRSFGGLVMPPYFNQMIIKMPCFRFHKNDYAKNIQCPIIHCKFIQQDFDGLSVCVFFILFLFIICVCNSYFIHIH